MSIISNRRRFLGRATAILLVVLAIFSGSSLYFAPARTVNASSWAGWDGMDTIAILPSSDEFPDTAAQELKTYLEEGELLEFNISATDADGDQLVYSASNLPEGASFDPNTQTFSWTPRYHQAGVYTVHFEVSDGELTDSEDVTITVVQIYEDWDVNGDGAANVLDMVLVGQHWGETGLTGWIREDASEDGTVNVLDMIIIGQYWTG